ncbi:MAG: hypothetical protein KIT31_33265 [Deltaproteobacteria bacterium]|nr:hypothetical protein [Deltaproteobacteria bacterium]
MTAGAVLVVVMVGATWRPRGISIAWFALGGALICGALGLVSFADLEQIATRTWDAALALIGLVLISAVLDANGAFRAAAHRVARAGGGSGMRLFWGTCGLAFATTSVLANDGAILLVTPIVADLMRRLACPPRTAIAFLFATGFVCDALSTLLPTSNLTNILLVDTLGVGTFAFVGRMALPTLAMFGVAVVVLTIQFGAAIPRTYAVDALGDPPPFARASARATMAALVALVLGYIIAALVRFPLGVVIVAVAIALAAAEHHHGTFGLRRAARHIPFGIVTFAASLFVIVTAFFNTGGDALVARALAPTPTHELANLLAAGVFVGAAAAIANNLPVFLISLLALERLGEVHALPFAALVGANVGAKLTPVGTLATLLWLGLLRQYGIRMSWWRYVALAIVPVALTLLAGLVMLA